MCYKIRYNLMMFPMSQFLYVIVTGFLTIMAPMFSVIIIYKKYQLENQHLFKQKVIAPHPSEL